MFNFTTIYSLQYGVIEVRVGAAEDKVGDLVPVGHCPSAVFTTSIHQGSLAGNISLLGSHSHTSVWKWNLEEWSVVVFQVKGNVYCLTTALSCHSAVMSWQHYDMTVLLLCTVHNLFQQFGKIHDRTEHNVKFEFWLLSVFSEKGSS